MPIFCQKNVSSLKKTVLPCYLFQIYHEKRYAVIPKSAQKNVNSVKTTLSYGPKKLIGSYFFPIFNQETTLLMPIFLSKIVRSLKNTMLSCPYFIQKTYILSKAQCSSVILYIFLMNPPPPRALSCPYLV